MKKRFALMIATFLVLVATAHVPAIAGQSTLVSHSAPLESPFPQSEESAFPTAIRDAYKIPTSASLAGMLAPDGTLNLPPASAAV